MCTNIKVHWAVQYYHTSLDCFNPPNGLTESCPEPSPPTKEPPVRDPLPRDPPREPEEPRGPPRVAGAVPLRGAREDPSPNWASPLRGARPMPCKYKVK